MDLDYMDISSSLAFLHLKKSLESFDFVWRFAIKPFKE
jgi:hypothetical protein